MIIAAPGTRLGMSHMPQPQWGNQHQTGHHGCCHAHHGARDTSGARVARAFGSQPVMTVTEQGSIIVGIFVGLVVLLLGGVAAVATVFGIYGAVAGWMTLIGVAAFAVFLGWAAREWKRTGPNR